MSEVNGVTFSEIQRFICEMNGLDYDEKVTEKVWAETKTYDDFGIPVFRWAPVGFKLVRKHKGIWATNLCSGPDPILRNYCYKSGKLWYVHADTKALLAKKNIEVMKSSLEQEFKSDEIPNNSKVVERTFIKMQEEVTLAALQKRFIELRKEEEQIVIQMDLLYDRRMQIQNEIGQIKEQVNKFFE
jgi:hypothetical protein